MKKFLNKQSEHGTNFHEIPNKLFDLIIKNMK